MHSAKSDHINPTGRKPPGRNKPAAGDSAISAAGFREGLSFGKLGMCVKNKTTGVF
jgi:hypothetical protein